MARPFVAFLDRTGPSVWSLCAEAPLAVEELMTWAEAVVEAIAVVILLVLHKDTKKHKKTQTKRQKINENI